MTLGDRLAAIGGALRDASDIARHARGPGEIVRALVPALQTPRVLNDAAVRPAAEVGVSEATRQLAALRLRLKAEVLTNNGGVDYAGLASSSAFAELETVSRCLAHTTLEFVSDAERTAFWINLYNIVTIHGVIAFGIHRSVMEIPSFFSRVAYRVAGHVLTLDEIENGVLRRNSPHPVTGRRLFGAGDPRLALAPATIDGRIHMALVCAAKSCPPISMYDAEHLDAQLDLASASMIASGVEIDDRLRAITVPLVFRWYSADFGSAGVPGFLVQHATGGQRVSLERALGAGYELSYSRYDWTLNAG